MLAGYNHNITSVVLGLGSVVSGTTALPVFKAPFGGATILGVDFFADDAINAGTVDYVTFTLLNGGAVGTSTTAIGTAGGTTAWTALTAKAASLNTALDELASGEYLVIKGVLSGALADNQFSAIIRWVHGQG